MGMDLIGRGGSMSLHWDDWRSLLKLAEQYGWQPEGTTGPLDQGRLSRRARTKPVAIAGAELISPTTTRSLRIAMHTRLVRPYCVQLTMSEREARENHMITTRVSRWLRRWLTSGARADFELGDPSAGSRRHRSTGWKVGLGSKFP